MNELLTRFRNAAAAACLVSLLADASCSTAASGRQNLSTNMIYYIGTPQYDKKVKEFKIKQEAAQRLVTEYMEKGLSNTNPKIKPTGRHQFVINNAYHFYMPQKFGGIPLTGYYVDGNTGKVQFKDVEGTVPYPQKRRKSPRNEAGASRSMDPGSVHEARTEGRAKPAGRHDGCAD